MIMLRSQASALHNTMTPHPVICYYAGNWSPGYRLQKFGEKDFNKALIPLTYRSNDCISRVFGMYPITAEKGSPYLTGELSHNPGLRPIDLPIWICGTVSSRSKIEASNHFTRGIDVKDTVCRSHNMPVSNQCARAL